MPFIHKAITINHPFTTLDMLIYLAFLVVSASAALQDERIKRLAWNMDILCRDYRDAVSWYPELPPPKDTHETMERVRRVTYGAVWRAMPALRTGASRKEQYKEEWWQWMSSSWSQRIPYAALGIKTGNEFARRDDESWEQYQQRMSKALLDAENRTKISPAALPMLQQQMQGLALTSKRPAGLVTSAKGSTALQDNHVLKLTDIASNDNWLSMGRSLAKAISRMNPEELGPVEEVSIDGVAIASMSTKDIMQRDPMAIAAHTAMQFLAGEDVGRGEALRFDEDGTISRI